MTGFLVFLVMVVGAFYPAVQVSEPGAYLTGEEVFVSAPAECAFMALDPVGVDDYSVRDLCFGAGLTINQPAEVRRVKVTCLRANGEPWKNWTEAVGWDFGSVK